ncbi:phage major capsid protein [Hyphomonadaceae bacterium ML37]|nr:phage major capsid protein [Hyphomonadaceae bacterium ML37]
MLESVKIQRRQSEVRERLAALAANETPNDTETRELDSLDTEYRVNEKRYRAALIAEAAERREAGEEIEGRSEREWSDVLANFELRQIALHLDEGAALSGQTAEIVQEMRAQGGYRGTPVPWQALEVRNTVAAGVPDPMRTAPIIDRLFPQSVASRMGASLINIASGGVEYPVTSSAVSAGWQDGENANVSGPTAFTTVDRPMKPDHTLGVQMRVSRRALKQAGDGLEQAIRRDLNGAISAKLDEAAFLGTGANGQPLGVITGAATYGVNVEAEDALASWALLRAAVTRFMVRNAASSPADVRALIRPELWDFLDGELITGTSVSEWDRVTRAIPAANFAMSSNALGAPAGDPLATSVLLTTSAGGQAPMYLATWGGIDLVRDPYTDAQSGGLRLTGLVTADVTISRAQQLEVLTGVELAGGA